MLSLRLLFNFYVLFILFNLCRIRSIPIVFIETQIGFILNFLFSTINNVLTFIIVISLNNCDRIFKTVFSMGKTYLNFHNIFLFNQYRYYLINNTYCIYPIVGIIMIPIYLSLLVLIFLVHREWICTHPYIQIWQ